MKTIQEKIEKLIPVLSEKEKQEILAYHVVFGKYESEISVKALEELRQHPIIGKLLDSIPVEQREAQDKISKEYQRDAIVNNNWAPYVEYQLMQGAAYAQMGLDFNVWYDLVILAKKYIEPCIYKESTSNIDLMSVLCGMNRFFDIALAIITEAYLEEKQNIIEREREQLNQTIQEVKDYKYALDESSIVAVTDQKGIIKHVNENFCRISKYTPQELIGKDHRIINSGYHSADFIKNLWTTIASGKVWKGEIKNKAKDGTIYWVDTTIIPFLNDKNKPFQYLAIRSDITERKKSEEEVIALNEALEKKVALRTRELQESLEKIENFQFLFETIPGMFLVLYPDLRITAVTNEYLEAAMVKREDILGKNLFDVFPDNPDDPNANGVSKLHESLKIVLKTKKSHRMDIQKYDIKNEAGIFEERYWSPINKPVLDANGTIIYLAHGVMDVTKQLKDQQKIISISEENHDLYNNAPCGYLSVDDSIFITNINQTLLNWLGYEAWEVIGVMKFEDLLSPESRQIHLSTFEVVFARYLETGAVTDLEYDFQRKDKSTFPTILNSVAVFDENGNFVKSRTAVIDNSFRKKSEHNLREANAELEAQAQKLQASEEELKAQQEELMQTNVELEEKSLLLEEKNQVVNEKNLELIAAAQELFQKADELTQISKYKSEFLANMSHELRTPLNSILLLSRVLADNSEQNLSAEQIEFARVINNSGNSLLELINDILDLSKIESGNMSVDIETVAVETIFRSAQDLFLPVAKERGIFFEVGSVSGKHEIIKTDRIRLEQVIKNFLSNAIKFTAEGGVTLSVRNPTAYEAGLLKVNKNKYVTFEVKDTGIGIPEEKQELIFEAFKQADGSTRRKFGGTGLGLSISRKIANMLGGDVVLMSEDGKGSSFNLVIPLDGTHLITKDHTGKDGFERDQTFEKADFSAFSKTDVLRRKSGEVEDDRKQITANDKTILIIDHDSDTVKLLVQNFHQHGFKVVISGDGSNALQLAQMYLPAAIFINSNLSAKSGWAILNELKSNYLTRQIPVQIIGSEGVKLNKVIEQGAVNFFRKPITKKAVGEMLKECGDVSGKFPKKVLLVDDNEIHIRAMEEFISADTVECIRAKAIEDAAKLIGQKKFDCLVIEMGLADEGVISLLEIIKGNKKFERLPVVVYTGKILSLQTEKKIKAFADDMVIKFADSFKDLSNKVSLFLHQPATGQDERKPLKPYIKEKALDGKHILIADDDVRNIFSLTKLLEQKKMKVSSAVDGNEAMTVLRNDKSVDLILLDMMMPNMDGYETISQIRKSKDLKKTKIIALTAKAMMGDREKCIKAGANDYLTKPVDVDQLISLLKIWLYI